MKKKNPNKKTLIGKQDFKVSNLSHEWSLFHNDFSLCSRKVRVCLAELKIVYHSSHIHLIETKDCENLSKNFLKINPNATVPVLLHNNYPIYESHKQIEYISNLYSRKLSGSKVANKWNEKGSLVGDDPVKGMENYAGNCVSLLTQPLFVAMLSKISFFKFIKYFIKHPSKFRAFNFILFKLIGNSLFKKNSINQRIAMRALKHLKIHLNDLNTHLSSKKWIDGDQFSIADITWMVLFHRLNELQILRLLLTGRENLNLYYERLKERESFKNCIINFSDESTLLGIEKLKSDIKTSKNLSLFYQLMHEEIKPA